MMYLLAPSTSERNKIHYGLLRSTRTTHKVFPRIPFYKQNIAISMTRHATLDYNTHCCWLVTLESCGWGQLTLDAGVPFAVNMLTTCVQVKSFTLVLCDQVMISKMWVWFRLLLVTDHEGGSLTLTPSLLEDPSAIPGTNLCKRLFLVLGYP